MSRHTRSEVLGPSNPNTCGKKIIPPDVIELAGTSKRDTKSLEVLNLRPHVIEVGGTRKRGLVGRQGFEPWKPMATDLQSAPFVHLGTCPNIKPRIQFPASRQEQTTPHSFPLLKRTKKGKLFRLGST